ncbi:zinc finger protein 732-like isoform X2 [Periplaneta americana]|uniref:zinc finger protein 732-like isoform X2 n=1 Tax=Periplaneta americana TaxID=6978 RepID=UPI0037E98EEB
MEKGRDICFNFNQICRFCLSQGGVMSAIFADSGQEMTSLPTKIMSCVSIQIYAGDGLPALICHRCLYQVERSYEFKEQCEHSDATLRQYLKKQRLGDTCQVVTIKQENIQEDSSQDAENGVMHFASDCSGARDDNMGAKQNEMLYKAGPQLLDIEPSSLQGDKPSAAEWTYSLDMTANNFLFEKREGLFHAGSLIFKPEDIDSVVVVVDPHAMDMDSMSDDDCSEEGENKRPVGISLKKSCSKIINKTRNLKRGKKVTVAAKTGGERPFSCPECGKTFAQRAHLARHELVHTGERPYGCSICGKAFADSSTLTTHMRTHTGERPFVCDICGKAFAGRSDLRKHAIIHTGRRPYVCSVCSKAFTRSTNLKKHARIHSGVRPHACRECSKTFAAKGDLTRHALIHSGCKPFVCTVCNVAFARRDKLTRHEKTHIRDQLSHVRQA